MTSHVQALLSWLAVAAAGVAVGVQPLASTDEPVARSFPAPCTDFYVPCNVSYHNVATLGPVPKYTVERAVADEQLLQSLTANEYFSELLDETGGEFPKPGFVTRMDGVREQAAAFIGAYSNETALFASTTLALNAVVEGLVSSGFLQHGDHVLTTDQEHAGGLAGWRHHQANGLIDIDVCSVPIPDDRELAAVARSFENAMTNRTKVLAVSHVSTTTGAVLPVAALAEMAHRHGAVIVVDGAQALGMDINVHSLGIDAYATSAHKWLLAPTGNGILYVREAFQRWVKPTVLDGGLSCYTGSSGTRAAYTTLALGHSLDYLSSFGGLPAVARYARSLASVAWAKLSSDKMKSLGIRVLTPEPPLDVTKDSAPIVTFELPPGTNSSFVGKELFRKHRVVVKMTGRARYPDEWPVGSPEEAIRVTFHIFNFQDEIEQMVEAVHEVVKNARNDSDLLL